MARIRTIKPEFFTSEDIVSLTPLARLFYVSLWCEADREGRLEWKPRTLKYRYLPGDDCDIEQLAGELTGAGLIILYEVHDKRYAEIPSFKKHQVINNRESASVIPVRKDEKAGACIDASATREGRVKAEGKEGREGKEIARVLPSGDDNPVPTSFSPPAATIPLIDGSDYEVSAKQIEEWALAYPAVDVLQQLREMRAWSAANPSNRKTRKGVARFIVRWLGREQDAAARVPAHSRQADFAGVL